MSSTQISPAAPNAGTSDVNGAINRLDAVPDASLQALPGGRAQTVGGIAIRGEPSRLETITGTSHSTGKVMQGDLMFGRTSTGSPMFWLKGSDTNYVLRSTDGKLLTNPQDARGRAQQLIAGGGAARLRTLKAAPAATEMRAPNSQANKIRIDLEDPAINNLGSTGRSGFAFGTGEKGSALTSTDAVQNARNMGLPVTVFNETPNLASTNANMHAVVEFSNDAIGGRQFANATAHPGGFTVGVPTYKTPINSSAAFKKGFADASREISYAQLGASAQNIASGMAGIGNARPNVSVTPRQTTTTQVIPRTPSVSKPGSTGRTLRSAAASPTVRKAIVPTSVAATPRSQSVRAMRQAQSQVPTAIKGKIAVRPGINLGKLEDFKLQTLPAIAQKHAVPEGELRVMVFVRHGESMANKTETFAGNVPGIRTPTGWVRSQSDAFTSLPNGEVMAPGGQIPLSQLGQQQARDAAPLIQQLRQTYDIKNSSVSPVLRAQETYRLATEGQPRFANSKTVFDLAERGMGAYIGSQKNVHGGNTLNNADIRLDGRGGGFVGGVKARGDTPVVPTADGGRARANRPVEDRTGFEDWSTFNGRIGSAFNRTVLPDVVNGSSLQVTHQYSIASQLKRIDPRIDTATLGHGIPNGQPLVVIVRVQQRGTAEPKLTVLEAGYYRGNTTPPAAKAH